MIDQKRHKLLSQIVWDYNISTNELDNLLKGKIERAGHYTREMIFKKVIESYPWFTVLYLYPPNEILEYLTTDTIKQLRSKSLRVKYEFIRRRLQEVIQTAG
jgi:hypothetical protein